MNIIVIKVFNNEIIGQLSKIQNTENVTDIIPSMPGIWMYKPRVLRVNTNQQGVTNGVFELPMMMADDDGYSFFPASAISGYAENVEKEFENIYLEAIKKVSELQQLQEGK